MPSPRRAHDVRHEPPLPSPPSSFPSLPSAVIASAFPPFGLAYALAPPCPRRSPQPPEVQGLAELLGSLGTKAGQGHGQGVDKQGVVSGCLAKIKHKHEKLTVMLWGCAPGLPAVDAAAGLSSSRPRKARAPSRARTRSFVCPFAPSLASDPRGGNEGEPLFDIPPPLPLPRLGAGFGAGLRTGCGFGSGARGGATRTSAASPASRQ